MSVRASRPNIKVRVYPIMSAEVECSGIRSRPKQIRMFSICTLYKTLDWRQVGGNNVRWLSPNPQTRGKIGVCLALRPFSNNIISHQRLESCVFRIMCLSQTYSYAGRFGGFPISRFEPGRRSQHQDKLLLYLARAREGCWRQYGFLRDQTRSIFGPGKGQKPQVSILLGLIHTKSIGPKTQEAPRKALVYIIF